MIQMIVAIWREMKMLFSLCLVVGLAACAEQSARLQVKPSLPPDFSAEFDRLFLSQQPLRYQDNERFLGSVQEAKLSPKEREVVRAKLKEFLSAKARPRPYAPNSRPTGVASEIAFLRLQALRVLAEIGTKEDAAFLRHLNARADEHPLFGEESKAAIKRLETR
jgi:hypothetical protein